MIDDLTLSWMAGFVDGEGTITISTVAKSKKYVPKLAVANTNYDAIEQFTKVFGGKVRLKVWKGDEKSNWKPCYEWSITFSKATKAIRLLEPFLKIKNKQADIVLQVEDLRKTYNGATLRWNPNLKEEVFDKLAKLKTEVQLLNKRGLK